MNRFRRWMAAGLAMVVAIATCSGSLLPVASAEETTQELSYEELTEINAQTSREMSTEGMVLVQNENDALPLPSGDTVAVFGKGQIDWSKGGGGSGDVTTKYNYSLLDGLESKVAEGKIRLNETILNKYKATSSYTPNATECKTAATQSSTAIIVITRTSGEGSDRSATKGSYYLSDSEETLVKNVCTAGFQRIIVILNICAVTDTGWIENYPQINSVLVTWQPGAEGGMAAADILVGDAYPSGKLPDTFPKDYSDFPTGDTFTENPLYVNYTEDIYVGYRYFETFAPDRVMYPFGYGLSYTTFRIFNTKVTYDAENITVTATVRNTGSMPGKEVVQVYFGAPQGQLGKPAKELAAFCKTQEIAPGASENVTMTFAISDMASYDCDGKIQKSAYVLEAGDYQIYVGNSVRDATVAGTWTLDQDTVTQQCTEVLPAVLLEQKMVNNNGTVAYETLETNAESLGTDLSLTDPVILEAEDCYQKHSFNTCKYSDDFSQCGLYINTSSDCPNHDAGQHDYRWITWYVNAPVAGDYNLTVTYSNSGSTRSNSVAVYVNDVPQTGESIGFASTGGTWNFKTSNATTFHLNQGANALKIYLTNCNDWADVIDFITVRAGAASDLVEPEQRISVSGTEATIIPAASFISCNEKVGIETVTTGPAAGEISVKGLDQKDATMSYALDVAQAGTYQLAFEACNGYGSDHDDGIDCYINGVDQDITFKFPYNQDSSNQWFNFITLDAGTITLPAGSVTLKLVVCSSFGNLYRIVLTPVAAAASVAQYDAANTRETTHTFVGITFQDVVSDPSKMEAFLNQLSDYELANLLQGHSSNLPRQTGSIGGDNSIPNPYGILAVETADGPAGLNMGSVTTTAFPTAVCLASSWNVDLLEAMGTAVGKECVAMGVDVWLAPAMNTHRNPLCGRNFEYYSEDPLIAGKMAAAVTRGCQAQGVGVTIKHFAANERETERGLSDSRMTERAMREIYIEAFRIAVEESHPWCVMSSYNRINGVETAESYGLLTTILRDEWGFDGVVMTDWYNDSYPSKEIRAGNDVKMAVGNMNELLGALNNGKITREEITLSATRVLNLVMRSNAMKRPLNVNTCTVSGTETTRIKFVDSSYKYSGIGQEACEDVDGGYNTTNTWNGRWISFLCNVEKAGLYTLKARVAVTDANGSLPFDVYTDSQILLDDQGNQSVTGIRQASMPATKATGATGWQAWYDTQTIQIYLPAGETMLTFWFTGGGNANWFELTPASQETVTITGEQEVVLPGTSGSFTVDSDGGAADFNWSILGNQDANTRVSDGVLNVGELESATILYLVAEKKTDSSVVGVYKVSLVEDAPNYLLGDMNLDGNLSVTDVVLLRKAILQGTSVMEVPMGDMNEDGSLSVTDVVLLRKTILQGS